MTLIVACGLKREARVIARHARGAAVVAGGGDPGRLERELDALAMRGPAIILSSGLAGALDPALRIGDMVVDGDAALVARLLALLPDATRGPICGSDTIAATVAGKAALRASSGAVAVDMETHVAARVADRHGLCFAALRVISDRADHDLPVAARVGMRADGGIALGAVLGSLVRRPGQLPALIRTGKDAGRAMRALGRALGTLAGAGFA